MADDSEFLKTWTRNGHIIPEGENYQRLEYARTLEIIGEDPMTLYEGEMGDAIVKAIQDKGGLMTKQDLIGEWAMFCGMRRSSTELGRV
jgi:gamma-glutamyltranspeptidase